MARSRMINKDLISKDNFLQLPCTTQLLYFHLCLNADDDGFVDRAITLIKQIPVNREDLKLLIEKGYLLFLEEYLFIITHWRQHNRIDKNHYVITTHIDYIKKIFLDENNVYSLNNGTNLYDLQVKRGYIQELLPSASLGIEDNLKKN